MADQAINSRGAKLATAQGMAQARLEVAAHFGTTRLKLISKRSLILGAGAAIVTRPARALIALRNPLVYPGRSPVLNVSHPMAKGGRLAAIPASGGGFINLVPGAPGVLTGGALTYSMQPIGGPAVLSDTAGHYNKFTNSYSDSPASFSVAAIFNYVAPSAPNCVFTTDFSAISGGAGLLLNSLAILPFNNGAGTALTGASITGGWLFTAFSYNAATINWVIINLSTSKLTSGTHASGGAVVVGSSAWSIDCLDATYAASGCQIAAVAYSVNNFMSVPQLNQWAAAPWDYWYSPMKLNLMEAGLRNPNTPTCPPSSLTGWGC